MSGDERCSQTGMGRLGWEEWTGQPVARWKLGRYSRVDQHTDILVIGNPKPAARMIPDERAAHGAALHG